MKLDITELPVIWIREHDEDETHDDKEDSEQFLAVLRRNERFVLIAARAPRLSDISEMDPEERKERAKLFKTHRQDLTRLCKGMILIGRAANLPLPVRKAIEKMSSAMGIDLLFADSEPAALALAQIRLAAT